MFSNSFRCRILKLSQQYCTKRFLQEESLELSYHKPQKKVLKVGIIGFPNAGKSTFINSIMDRKVCPTSSKIHTTRSKSVAIFTEDDSQIIICDTPGLVNEKEINRYKLERSFENDIKDVLKNVDYIGVIHDVTSKYNRTILDIKIIHLLQEYQYTPSFLVLNKVDTLKSKRILLDLARLLTENSLNGIPLPSTIKRKPRWKDGQRELRGWPYFKNIFMVSALTGDGVGDVKKYFLENAIPGDWPFAENDWTEEEIPNIIIKFVKAKLLDFLQQELPYKLKSEIEYYEMENVDNQIAINTVVNVKCPSKRIAKLIAGDSDGRLRILTENVQKELQEAIQMPVRLRIVLYPPYKE